MSKHIKLNKDIVKGIKQILWANYKELPEKKCKMYEIAQALHMHENKLSLINTGRLYPEVPWPTGTQGSFNDAIIEESETKGKVADPYLKKYVKSIDDLLRKAMNA